MMNFSTKVKKELTAAKLNAPCCKVAALSAFLRTAGSIESKNGCLGFSTSSESFINEFFAKIIADLYGATPEIKTDNVSGRSRMSLIGDVGLRILLDTEIISIDESGVEVKLGISEYLVENDCCKQAFIKGAFLGSGSITVPKIEKTSATTGYHVEFVFSKYAAAQDFSILLGERDFISKMIERKDSFVIYFKNSEELCDLLSLMGANKARFELDDIILQKTIKNNTNRSFNCEMSNINKTVDAAVKVCNDIEIIKSCIGLEALPETLQVVAKARLADKYAPLSRLAEDLGITKSCLSHRLKRLSEIADSL